MQAESVSNPYERRFSNRIEEEEDDTDNKVEEERKQELVGSRMKIEVRRTRTEGRVGDEEERTRR